MLHLDAAVGGLVDHEPGALVLAATDGGPVERLESGILPLTATVGSMTDLHNSRNPSSVCD